MGKESSAPAPDPRLVEAQVRSLGIQEDAVNRMLKISEEMAPLQRQEMETALQRSGVLWDQSQADREFALGKRSQLSGIQDAIAQESARFSESDRRDQLAGQASSDVEQAFENARGQLEREKTRMGVNPNDGRGQAMSNSLGISEALAKVTGRNLAGQQARGERLGLQDRANNVLAGYPAMSAGSVGTGMGTMGAGMQVLNGGMGGLMSGQQAAASGAAGVNSTAGNMWGQQASRYDRGQQAQGQENAAIGSAIGAIAMAMM